MCPNRRQLLFSVLFGGPVCLQSIGLQSSLAVASVQSNEMGCFEFDAAGGAMCGAGGGAASNLPQFESGDKAVDDGVRRCLDSLSSVFGIEKEWLPDFSFFDDDVEGSACIEKPIKGFKRSQLRIGRNLANSTKIISKDHFGGALTGIFAHEFAHIFQLQENFIDRLGNRQDSLGSVRLLEMHADYLAGWCLPQLYWINGLKELQVASTQFMALGDRNFTSSTHHGTKLQRQSAMTSGFVQGLMHPKDPTAAANAGIDFLKELFPTWFRS